MRAPARAQRGFTLLEVMIALGILFGALTILVGGNLRNARLTKEARALTIATTLARGKMFDVEEELTYKGFQETAETLDGDFDEEGYPAFSWKAQVEKVEIPGAAALAQGEGDDGSGTGSTGTGSSSALGGGLGASAGFGMLASQFGLIQEVLEQAIRKVTLTVTWKVGRSEQEIVVVCYFTNPRAVDLATQGLPDPAALPGGTPGGPGATPGGPGTNPGGTGTNPGTRR